MFLHKVIQDGLPPSIFLSAQICHLDDYDDDDARRTVYKQCARMRLTRLIQ